MSANNWRDCPRCMKRNREAELAKLRTDIETHGYQDALAYLRQWDWR